MPRQSAASLALSVAHATAPRPQPSPDLSPEARQIFEHLVATSPRGHFRVSDEAVIETYAAAVAQLRQAEHEIAKAGGPVTPVGRSWAKVRNDASKVIGSLSMRLRCCPQARQTSRANSRQKGYVGPAPWE